MSTATTSAASDASATEVKITNMRAELSHYGEPTATFDETPITIARRNVFVELIFWDAEYDCYRAVGHYAKKDGTCGNQIAKPIMGAFEVPTVVLDALAPIIARTH